MQPNISLFYDSQASIGPLGIGWSIGGLGSITRCNKTVAQDTTAAPVTLVVGDGYCINGSRLRLTSGTYGTAGSVYQTEIADFSQITAVGTAGNGPASFTVQGRNGLTYYYGCVVGTCIGTNSQVLANGTTTALTWLLSKVVDRAGNNYVINYTAQTGTAVPNDILWTPTSAGASTYAYKMLFNYTTNVPQSSIHQYVDGTLVSNTELLSSIEIYSGTTVVKDYFLGYQASPLTEREELISLTECADAGKANCLLPTAIGYQAGTPGLSTTANTAASAVGPFLTTRYDLNGDGYPDLTYSNATTGQCYVAFGSASGYGTPVSTGVCPTLIGNLTGGPEDGLLVVVSGTWWYYTWNGSSFTGVSLGVPYDSATDGYQLADINGDGLPDLIDLDVVYNPDLGNSKATIYTRLNTSHGTTASFSSTATAALTLGALASAQLLTPDNQYGKLRRYDFNGDGLDDLVLMTINGKSPNYTLNTHLLLSTGTTFTPSLISTGSGDSYVPVYFTNWNDDKCTDFVSLNTLYVSACDGTASETYPITGTVLGALDWDGDGRTDLLVANGTKIGVYLSKATGAPTLTTTLIPYVSTCQYVWMDANGDGLDDLGCWSQTGSSPLTYYLHNGTSDLATSFVDGYGNGAIPSYGSIANSNYTNLADAVYPYQNYIGPMYVVDQVTFSDPSKPPGGTYRQTFTYAGAWMNLQGRGFQGYKDRSTVDTRTALYEYQYYERSFPYTGMMYEDVFSNGSVYPRVSEGNPVMLTLDSTANNERYFPYFNSVTTLTREVGGAENGDLITTTVNTFAYDSYGNATTIDTTVTDNDPGSPYVNDTWTSTTVNTIEPDTSTWCLNLPTETTVTNSSTAAGGAAITRTVNYTPDYTNCRQTQKVIEPSSSTYKVTDAYTYDSFGNPWTDTVTGVGMAARVTTLTWGTTGQFLTTVTNPLTPVITLGYDPASGRLTSQSDPNSTSANPIVTTWLYDPFFRKTQETGPDGTYTTWSYNDCASAGGCLFGSNALTLAHNNYASNAALLNSGTTYFDQIDRPVMATATMLSGSLSRTDTRYDSLGRIAQQSMPCIYSAVTTPCTYWTTNTYDVINRLTQSQRPISSTNSTLQTTAFGYAGRTTTVTDPLNNTTTKINFVTGAVARSKDPKGYYQNFTYDAFGSLLSVTDSASPSHTLSTATYKYGIQAFKTASTDVDMGARSYTVDALGEVTAYSDAKSQNFSMTYDALSRPLVRTEPDLTTTWTWGSAAASYNIGKLQSVTAASTVGTYSDAYTYDSRTRLSSELTSNPGDRTYNYIWTYNPTTGQLSSLQYPVDISFILTLQYAYSNGILQSISSNSYTPTQVFWTADATNPRGQVTQETLGNGAVINRNFDAVTGWLGSVQAGAGGGATLQNNSYAYDYDGNVTQRQDNNRGLTENFYYDTVNRLDHSALNGNQNLQMTYDAIGMGNIASRSDLAAGAAWTYDPVHIHQVTQAGSASNAYVYDANGNVTSRNGYAVTWSSYNYPTGVNSAGESVTFQYGPNRERWQEIYTGPNGVEKTNRAGKLFEVAIYGGLAHYRHYVFAGNELVAVDDRTTAASPLYYIVGDHQGGIASIENSANPGTNFVSESFTAFGMRRSGETWSGPVSPADETAIDGVSRHGYTDQSVLGVNMYLNHMNGRVQDAITGRFLSPDPNVPDPGNTQSWNRYSYVNNNPLTYTDPTGFRIGKYVCRDFCPNFGRENANMPSIDSLISPVSTGITFRGGSFDDTDAALGIDPSNSGSATVGSPISSGQAQSQDPSTAQSQDPTQGQTPGDQTAQSPQQSQVPQLAEIAVTANRLPDYVTFQLDLYVFSVSATYTVYGDVFFGKGASRSYPNARFGHVGVSISDGWMLTPNNVAPDPSALNNFLINWSGSVGGYDFVGGSYQFNSAGMSINAGVGFGGFGASPGIINSYQGNIFGNQ